MIYEACLNGSIARLRNGLYGVSRNSVVAIAASHGGAVGCISALSALGVWLLDKPGLLHVDVGRRARIRPHTDCRCIDHHIGGEKTFGIVTAKHALTTAWRRLSFEMFFVAYESAWNSGLISESDRAEILQAVPKRIRRCLRRARGDAGSGLESLLRFRLMCEGIELESKVYIEGVGRVDFRLNHVLFEIDVREYHDNEVAFHHDRKRDGAAIRAGYRTVRLDFAMIVFDWANTLAIVRSAIAQ